MLLPMAPYSDQNKYENQGVIKLEPKFGNALIAKNNGITGILIHVGSLGPTWQLRRTNGCLRMRIDELHYLKQLIDELSISDSVTTVDVTENGSIISPSFENASCG